jgi:pimeloyl-[acyl-carrier protein] methyl ester esterase
VHGSGQLKLVAETGGRGPSLVLLHGWGLHSGIWQPLLARLQRRFRLTTIDLPGHGHNRDVPGESLAAIASSTAATAPRGAAWLGWSLGGQVALAAALGGADISRLVLVSATPRFVSAPDWPCGVAPAVLAGFTRTLAEDPARTLRDFLVLQLRGDRRATRLLAELRRTLAARPGPSPEALCTGLEILVGTDLRAALPDVPQPALVIAGERDRLTPAEASRRLAAALPGGRFQGFAGTAHIPFLAQPDRFAAALEAFLPAAEACA